MEPSFKGWNVDCEYNRHGNEDLNPKHLEGIEGCLERKTTDWIIPDIIIHQRGSKDRNNLVVFEIKCNDKLDNCDIQKLIGLTELLGNFKYSFGIGLEFGLKGCERFVFADGEKKRESFPITVINFRPARNKDQNDERFGRCPDADYVFELNGDVIGHALAHKDANSLVIIDFEIIRDMRGWGHGTWFEQEFENYARNTLGKTRIIAFDVGDDSVGFWEKTGFTYQNTDGLDRDSYNKII